MKTTLKRVFVLSLVLLLFLNRVCTYNTPAADPETADIEYHYAQYPFERNGYLLYLDCVSMEGISGGKHILLIHGSAYSSHEFDINYQDYSFVRRLAREGYAVWRLDITGYGQSQAVEDGLLPDTEYASEDIRAAVEYIVQQTGCEKIDVLGWSWGTMTAGLFAGKYPEHLRKLVLYAPVLSGLGINEDYEPFHHNTWEDAAEDFQKNPDGTFNEFFTDPVIIELFCSSCWHYDGDTSPNGWRKDAMKEVSERLIDLDAITVPTLLIYGGNDPYMNYEVLADAGNHLPAGSDVQIIPGGSHIVILEKPFYREFQNQVIEFLR